MDATIGKIKGRVKDAIEDELQSAKGCYHLVKEFRRLIDKLIALRRSIGIRTPKDRLTCGFVWKDLVMMIAVYYLAWLGLKCHGAPYEVSKSCVWNMKGLYKTMHALCPTKR